MSLKTRCRSADGLGSGKRKEEAIKTYGITVSDDELHKKVRDILKDKSDYVEKTNKTLARLPKP